MGFIPSKIPENVKFDIKTINEEVANMYSHFAGVVFWFLAAPFLLYYTFSNESPVNIFGIVVYCITFLMIYSSSTLYHSSYSSKIRRRLRVFDHISIYFFISGSYTPIILLYINNDFGLLVLISLWIVTLIGTVFKIFFVERFRVISTVIYLLMGWTAVFIVNKLLVNMPLEIFHWIVAGGLFYTVGTYFYLHIKLKYNHFFWHLVVLFGSICHFVAIFKSVY